MVVSLFLQPFGDCAKTSGGNAVGREYVCDLPCVDLGNRGVFQRIIQKIPTLRKISWSHAIQHVLHDRHFSDADALRDLVMGPFDNDRHFRVPNLVHSSFWPDAVEKVKRFTTGHWPVDLPEMANRAIQGLRPSRAIASNGRICAGNL